MIQEPRSPYPIDFDGTAFGADMSWELVMGHETSASVTATIRRFVDPRGVTSAACDVAHSPLDVMCRRSVRRVHATWPLRRRVNVGHAAAV